MIYVCVVVGGGVILLSVFIKDMALWQYFNEDTRIKMNFKDWYKLYLINPDRWILGDNSLKCSHGYVGFSFRSYLQYKKLLRRIKKEKANAAANEGYEKIIRDAQDDINRLKVEAEKEKLQAADILSKIQIL